MKEQSQLELFELQQYQSDSSTKSGYRPKFLSFIKVYEKVILIIITFFIASLISFSLGVEKGKRLAGQTQLKKFEAKQILLTERLSEDKLEGKKDISKYTIQVATFKTEVYAQREVKRLEEKGVEASIVPRGDFVSVCVGNFSEKQEARVALKQLKKTYQDCFIRRL